MIPIYSMKETDRLLSVEKDRPQQQLTSQAEIPSSLWTLIRQPVVLSNTGSTARDHLANERTHLAWTRTALSLTGVGLALLRWQGIANSAGYLVFGLGLWVLVSSTIRYLRVMQQLSQNKFEPNVHSVLSMVAVMFLVVVVLLGLHLTNHL